MSRLSAADQRHLLRAVARSREHMERGEGGPFGAVIVREGTVLAEGWNQVVSTNDPTAPAEVVAIRCACQHLGRFALDGATLYAIREPCPMCLAADHWARVACIVYAKTRVDAAAIGFNDAFIYDKIAKPPSYRLLTMELAPAEEAGAVVADWLKKADGIPY
jgi:guanine deaminase